MTVQDEWPPLTIVVTFDIDPDPKAATNGDMPKWTAIEEGVSKIACRFRAVGRRHDHQLQCTWLVRADNQLKELYGTEDYLLQEYESTWDSLQNEGDEIGWHPHICRRQDKRWEFEYDPQRLRTCLRTSYEAIASHISVTSARVGGTYHTNESMRTLAELGIEVDSTALPGRRRDDDTRQFDWTPTPNTPYRPSIEDYRVPGERPLEIVEFPMTTIETMAPYDDIPLDRYLNLSFYSNIIEDGIESVIHDENRQFLVTITHPAEVLDWGFGHPVISYDMETTVRNLERILTECERIGRPYRFETLSGAADVLATNQNER